MKDFVHNLCFMLLSDFIGNLTCVFKMYAVLTFFLQV